MGIPRQRLRQLHSDHWALRRSLQVIPSNAFAQHAMGLVDSSTRTWYHRVQGRWWRKSLFTVVWKHVHCWLWARKRDRFRSFFSLSRATGWRVLSHWWLPWKSRTDILQLYEKRHARRFSITPAKSLLPVENNNCILQWLCERTKRWVCWPKSRKLRHLDEHNILALQDQSVYQSRRWQRKVHEAKLRNNDHFWRF